jgi:hypothetical protein
MKRIGFFVCIFLLAFTLSNAQTKKFYSSSGGEMIFSFANVDYAGNSDGLVMRFSPVFNFQSLVNYDLSNTFGLYSGLAIRNQGFIYRFPNDQEYLGGKKIKFRTYNLGIPFGFKVGNLQRFHLYGGYELEFPFHYKEKWFENDEKTRKITAWFTNRVPVVYNALFVGLQFPYGTNIKFKYYLTNFHNQDYTLSDGDFAGTKPYANLNANVFYISLSFFLFKNMELYYKEPHGSREI